MENLASSKLVALAKILTPKEWKSLAYWLKAPWSKNEPQVLALYELLSPHYPGFKAKHLDKATLYQQLFPQKAYNNQQLNYLIRKFTEDLQAFLAHLKLQKDPAVQQDTLTELLLERQQIRYFEEAAFNMLTTLETKSAKSAEDFLRIFQIHQALHYQPSSHRRYGKANHHLRKANDALNEFFLLESYRHISEQSNRSSALNQPNFSVPPALTQYLAHLRKQYISMPAALYEFRLQRTNTDWSTYLEFKQLFIKTRKQLPRSLQMDFLFMCINETVASVSKGQAGGLRELYQWYQWGIAENLLAQHNTITGITFNNVILTACHFDDIPLVEQFIKSYQNKLAPSLRKDAKRWATAHLAYVKGDFDTCIGLLEQQLPKQTIYTIQARLTLLKAHFKWVLADKSQGQRFQYYCLSLEQYFNRNSPYSAERTIATLRYIQYVKRIAKLSQSFSLTSKQITSLWTSIDNTPNLFGKAWLQKELQELKNKIEKGL
ncbi:MAG: hypothetical protein AAF960_10755 [Bacteroidota bacterium]